MLRIALEFPAAEPGGRPSWVELTESGQSGPIRRLQAPDLGTAQRFTARATDPVFLDLDVELAESVPQAYAAFAAAHPGWEPGMRRPTVVHPGTAATLAGLLADIWLARVADGVTLRSAQPGRLAHRVLTDLRPELSSYGIDFAGAAPLATAG